MSKPRSLPIITNDLAMPKLAGLLMAFFSCCAALSSRRVRQAAAFARWNSRCRNFQKACNSRMATGAWSASADTLRGIEIKQDFAQIIRRHLWRGDAEITYPVVHHRVGPKPRSMPSSTSVCPSGDSQNNSTSCSMYGLTFSSIGSPSPLNTLW